MKNRWLIGFRTRLHVGFETLAALGFLCFLIMLSFLINCLEYCILFLLFFIHLVVHFLSIDCQIFENNLGKFKDFKCVRESNLEQLVVGKIFILFRVYFMVFVISLKILAINSLRNLFLDHITPLVFHSLHS